MGMGVDRQTDVTVWRSTVLFFRYNDQCNSALCVLVCVCVCCSVFTMTTLREHCFYHGRSLKSLDVELMKRLHEKVNVIPLIAKADTLTQDECREFKRTVRWPAASLLVLSARVWLW